MNTIKICVNYNEADKIAYKKEFELVDRLPEIGACVDMSSAPNWIYEDIKELTPDISDRDKAEGFRLYRLTGRDHDGDTFTEYKALKVAGWIH